MEIYDKVYGLKTVQDYKSRGIPCECIYDAKKARDMTNEVIDTANTEQLNEIAKAIKKAISDGEFYITRTGFLKPEARKVLEKKGYKFTTGSQYNESYYTISWR